MPSAHEDVEVFDGSLQMHHRLAGAVVGLHQRAGVGDAAHPAPATAVKGLHVQWIAELLSSDGRQVEHVIVLVSRELIAVLVGISLGRDQPGLGYLEAQANHGDVGRVLFHALKGERVVEQIDLVEQCGLLEPLAGLSCQWDNRSITRS